MKKKHFYSHLIETESLIVQLDSLDLNADEKTDLISLIDSNLHHVILDTILSELSDEDKKILLHHVRYDNNDKIWELLNQRVDNIEEKIKKAAADLKKQLHKDIQEAPKK